MTDIAPQPLLDAKPFIVPILCIFIWNDQNKKKIDSECNFLKFQL